MGLFLITKRRALFYDNIGHPVGEMNISKTDMKFKFKERSFLSPSNYKTYITHRERKGLFFDYDEYYYNIDNPEPLMINKKVEPLMNSLLFDSALETSTLRELLSMSKSPFKINIKWVLIILGIAIVAYLGYTTIFK